MGRALGIDMVQRGERRRDHTRLIRDNPVVRATGRNPFYLDSLRPRMKLGEYRRRELRFQALAAADPAEAERLLGLAQHTADLRWQLYEEMSTRGAEAFAADAPRTTNGPDDDLPGPSAA